MIDIPTFFARDGLTNGLELVDLGVTTLMASFTNRNMTFDKFVNEASTHGPKEDRLSTFQIRQIVQKLEKDHWLRVIKYKDSYQVEWLPKAFGEGI